MSLVSCIKPIIISSTALMMIAASPAAAIVVNGTTGSVDQYDALLTNFGSVGQFHTTDGTYRYAGSGVAIADNWVLTAGHVAAGMNSMDFYLGEGGGFGSFTDGSRTVYDSATNWITHPKWSGNLSSGYDIALVYFENTTFADTASLYQGSSEIGETGTMVGYGMTGTGATGATTFDGQKRAGQNVIDALYDTPGKRSDPDRILLADFDSGYPNDDSFGNEIPLPLEAMIASGDSGGGLFINDALCEDTPCLAGITSFGWGRLDGDPNSDFGDVGGFTRVSALYDWIMSVISPPDSGGSGGGGTGNGKKGGPKAKTGNSFVATSVNVPEPGTLTIFGLGLAGLGLMRRRKRTA